KKLLRSLLACLVHAEVVCATEQRTGDAGALWDPPHAAYPVMSAVHHLFSDVVHHRGANLNRRIQRGVPRERLQQWIELLCAIGCDGAARRPGVESGGAVFSDTQSDPHLLFVTLLGE